MISRRHLLSSGLALVAAPVIIKVASLMPIRVQPEYRGVIRINIGGRLLSIPVWRDMNQAEIASEIKQSMISSGYGDLTITSIQESA